MVETNGSPRGVQGVTRPSSTKPEPQVSHPKRSLSRPAALAPGRVPLGPAPVPPLCRRLLPAAASWGAGGLGWQDAARRRSRGAASGKRAGAGGQGAEGAAGARGVAGSGRQARDPGTACLLLVAGGTPRAPSSRAGGEPRGAPGVPPLLSPGGPHGVRGCLPLSGLRAPSSLSPAQLPGG